MQENPKYEISQPRQLEEYLCTSVLIVPTDAMYAGPGVLTLVSLGRLLGMNVNQVFPNRAHGFLPRFFFFFT